MLPGSVRWICAEWKTKHIIFKSSFVKCNHFCYAKFANLPASHWMRLLQQHIFEILGAGSLCESVQKRTKKTKECELHDNLIRASDVVWHHNATVHRWEMQFQLNIVTYVALHSNKMLRIFKSTLRFHSYNIFAFYWSMYREREREREGAHTSSPYSPG